MAQNVFQKSTGVEMQEGVKKERLWTVPVISLAIAAIVISLILFRETIGGWFGNDDLDEPFARWSEETVEEKMENGDSFALFLYSEECPYCKEFMFGETDATSGNGPLQQWVSKDYDHSFGSYWGYENDEENDYDSFEDVEDYLQTIEDSIADNENIDSEQFKWRDRIWDPTSNSNTSKPSTTLRPGVPALFFFENGYLQTVLEGSVDRSELMELYLKVELAPIGPEEA